MTTLQIILTVTGSVLFVLFSVLALVIIGVLYYLARDAINTAKGFIAAMKDFAEVAAELKTIGKAISGQGRAANAMALECGKLRMSVERFGSFIMKPPAETYPPMGYTAPTDADAAKQYEVNEMLPFGYSKEEAAVIAENNFLGIA